MGLRGLAEHPAVAFGGALFAATLLDHAIRGARAARTSIQLRFENADLLERVRAEHDAAERAQRKAEQASAAKSQVLAAASHDLRQPVHAQGLFLELLGATELTERQRGLLARAGEAVDASAAMLGTLFDYSRIEAGVIRPQREAFAIQPMLNMIEREFGPQADTKGLTYRSRESALVLASDPALVGLILRNLVSNAIRYTRRGGLLVTCRQRGPEAWLDVWDTGIGIAPEHQAEVFREFHQLDNPSAIGTRASDSAWPSSTGSRAPSGTRCRCAPCRGAAACSACACRSPPARSPLRCGPSAPRRACSTRTCW